MDGHYSRQNAQPLPVRKQETDGHHSRQNAQSLPVRKQETDGHHSRQNVQPFERNIRTNVRSTTGHGHGPADNGGGARACGMSFILSQLFNRRTNSPPI
jgi:hypothetical protein